MIRSVASSRERPPQRNPVTILVIVDCKSLSRSLISAEVVSTGVTGRRAAKCSTVPLLLWTCRGAPIFASNSAVATGVTTEVEAMVSSRRTSPDSAAPVPDGSVDFVCSKRVSDIRYLSFYCVFARAIPAYSLEKYLHWYLLIVPPAATLVNSKTPLRHQMMRLMSMLGVLLEPISL